MGWQDDARRTVVSERIALTSFPGYWIRVRKYSIRATDAIQAISRSATKGLDKKMVFQASKKMQEHQGLPSEQLIELLDQKEFDALMDASTNVDSSAVIEAKIFHGIDSHNFCDGDIEIRSTNKDIAQWAHAILDYPDVAKEILALIEDFNRPLASQTSRISEMSPAGSTTEPLSIMGTGSQMDEIQPN